MSEVVFELLIPKRPVSLQAKATSLKAWKNYVYGRAFQKWQGLSINDKYLCLTLVYFCSDLPENESILDVDNIIKPVQDALVGIVFSDDKLISDVDCHRRFLADPVKTDQLPSLLKQSFLTNALNSSESLYIQVSIARGLGKYL